MIERLMNQEWVCGESEYSELSAQIVLLKRQLCDQLTQQGKDQLDQLTDVCLNQFSILRDAAFIEGFCAAADVMTDYLKHKIEVCARANQQRPPES